MASIVSICNLALSNLGAGNINALNEDSAEARACNQYYEHCRDLLLQSYPWRFAGKTVALAELTNDKPGAWGHAYSRPNDCLKVRWVRPQYSLNDPCAQTVQDEISHIHDVDGGVIYCNLPTAHLRYTQRLADVSKFSPLFIDALSWHLSVRLAMPITKDPKVRADAYQLATRMQAAAEVADANEARETSDHSTEYVTRR
jgi:hypothetical protein